VRLQIGRSAAKPVTPIRPGTKKNDIDVPITFSDRYTQNITGKAPVDPGLPS
jgi:hypothetical protein